MGDVYYTDGEGGPLDGMKRPDWLQHGSGRAAAGHLGRTPSSLNNPLLILLQV